jgi:polysaccharide export outer membrane protein
MRVVNGERVVYNIDLSVIEGLRYADMIIQANDYVYIEPKEQVTQESLKVIAPVVSLISSALIIISVISTIK